MKDFSQVQETQHFLNTLKFGSRILADIGDGERSDFNFIDIKRMIPLENTLVIRAQIAYYIDSEDTLIGKLFRFGISASFPFT